MPGAAAGETRAILIDAQQKIEDKLNSDGKSCTVDHTA